MVATRLAGVALASALMFACAGRMAPGDAASIPAPDDPRPPAAAREVQPEADGEEPRR